MYQKLFKMQTGDDVITPVSNRSKSRGPERAAFDSVIYLQSASTDKTSSGKY